MGTMLATGDVVWHRAPFKGASSGGRPDRPWLVVSNDVHPFHGKEYVALCMTTTGRERAIRIDTGDWVDGGFETIGYVSPWFVMTLKHADLSHRVGWLDSALVDDAVGRLFDCLGSDVSLS